MLTKYLGRLVEVLDSFKASLPAYGVSLDNPEFSKSDSNDVIRFVHDVFFKDFYSVIQEELNLGCRATVKLMMFTLLFRRINRVDPLTEKLNKLYPTVMKIIATFKKGSKKPKHQDSDIEENQESNFSLFLQSIEEEIFIDHILSLVGKKRFPVFHGMIRFWLPKDMNPK